MRHRFLSEQAFLEQVGNLRPLVALEITTTSTDLFTTTLPHDMAFVVGNERFGIAESILQQCDFAVHIPMFGINSSMNVAAALAIALYEWRRRFSPRCLDKNFVRR